MTLNPLPNKPRAFVITHTNTHRDRTPFQGLAKVKGEIGLIKKIKFCK